MMMFMITMTTGHLLPCLGKLLSQLFEKSCCLTLLLDYARDPGMKKTICFPK